MGTTRSTRASIIALLCAAACGSDTSTPAADSGVPDSHDADSSDSGGGEGSGDDGIGDGDGDDLNASDSGPGADMDADMGAGDDASADDGSGDSDGDDGDGPPEGQVPAIVAVGYGGLRVVSRDKGQSWTDAQLLTTTEIHADNNYLLRGIAWGSGLWIATGWKILLSNDGVVWDEVDPVPGCNVIESIAFGNGVFVAACGDSAYLTIDGINWENGGRMGAGDHPKIRFADGRFVVSGDGGDSLVSTDGRTWTALEGVSFARVCAGQIVSRADCPEEQPMIQDTEGVWVEDGVWLLSEWGGHIARSTDGVSYERVYTHEPGNASAYGFGAGYVAP